MSETNQSANEARLAHALLVATQELSSSRAECERLRETLDSLQACAESVMQAHGDHFKNSLAIDLRSALKNARAVLSEKEKA